MTSSLYLKPVGVLFSLMKEDAAMLEIDGESIEETGEGMEYVLTTILVYVSYKSASLIFFCTVLTLIALEQAMLRVTLLSFE